MSDAFDVDAAATRLFEELRPFEALSDSIAEYRIAAAIREAFEAGDLKAEQFYEGALRLAQDRAEKAEQERDRALALYAVEHRAVEELDKHGAILIQQRDEAEARASQHVYGDGCTTGPCAACGTWHCMSHLVSSGSFSGLADCPLSAAPRSSRVPATKETP